MLLEEAKLSDSDFFSRDLFLSYGATSFPLSPAPSKQADSQDARSSSVFFLLNFDELEQCSGRGIGYGPTIETVRIPIDKIVALIIE